MTETSGPELEQKIVTGTDVGIPEMTIRSRDQDIALRLDSRTGLPLALLIRSRGHDVSMPLVFSATLLTEGEEVRRLSSGATYDFGYVGTTDLSAFQLSEGAPHHHLNGPDETYTLTTQLDGWIVLWNYTFRRSHPRLEVTLDVSPQGNSEKGVLRDLRLDITCRLPDLASWRVEAPGNHLRPGVAADSLQEPVAVAPPSSDAGSAGLVVLHHPGEARALLLWPFSRTELGTFHLQVEEETLHFSIRTALAGRISPPETLHYEAIELDVLDRSWPEIRRDISSWYGTVGLSTPHDRSPWIEAAVILEVQIGYSVFWGDYRYAPYPDVPDLRADLGRIKGLGFTVLQIMPRQPYPSYNVHDYGDITTSYGDEAELRALVEDCHALGIRVILDILMHGVIDQEVMAQTASSVRSGPYFGRLHESTFPQRSGSAARDAMLVAWCRHILDFEPYWSGGSPARHSLTDEHPEWFTRDSAQNIVGIYTKAFDVANLAWQEYFTDAAIDLIRRLDIDGFRFDAPTYNALPNWSVSTERRASYSPLGCLDLFERLRTRLKSVKDSVILYTEPSGVLFRQSMDITYNYDEQWLIDSVLNPPTDEQSRRTLVRNGREMAAWFSDRNSSLPPGSLIAHHIDSHDSFWWPLPGSKWRREQYGLLAVRALLAVFSLSGGAYMTFVGGEYGIEEEVRRVHRLRATLPEVGRGQTDYEAVSVDRDEIYAVVRGHGAHCALLLVNLSNHPVDTVCSLDVGRFHLDDRAFEIYDAWNDSALGNGLNYTFSRSELQDLRCRFEAFQPRLLVVRPAAEHQVSDRRV